LLCIHTLVYGHGLVFRRTPAQVWLENSHGPKPDWKPFRKPLSLVGANQAMAKVQALFQYLVDVDYLAGNPWKPVKALNQDRVKGQDHRDQAVHERELPIEVIHAIEGYFDRGQDFQGIDAEQFARWHWGWTFFLYPGSRASSACTATVDDIYLDRRGHHLTLTLTLTLTVKGAGVRRKNVPWIPALERVYQAVQPNDGLAADRPEHPFDPPGSDRPTAEGRGSAASVVTGAIAPGATAAPCPTRRYTNR
jgi:integrase